MTGREESAEQPIVDDKSIELMSVDGQVPNSSVFPFIFFVYPNSNQVRHHF